MSFVVGFAFAFLLFLLEGERLTQIPVVAPADVGSSRRRRCFSERGSGRGCRDRFRAGCRGVAWLKANAVHITDRTLGRTAFSAARGQTVFQR